MRQNFNKIKAENVIVLFLAFGLVQEAISGESIEHKTTETETKASPSSCHHEMLLEDKENKKPNTGLHTPSKSLKRKLLWPDTVKPLEIETMDILQRGLFRPIVEMSTAVVAKTPPRKKPLGNAVVDLTKVTPEKLQNFKNLGGTTPELRKQFVALRNDRSPIRNTILFPPSTPEIFSPVARRVLHSRDTMRKAREMKAVVSLPPDAHRKPAIEETEEERLARKAAQEKDFLEAEQRRGKIPGDLKAEMRREFEIWQDHLNYIKMRKAQLSGEEESVMDDIADEEDEEDDAEMKEAIPEKEEKVRKIRKGEIEDAFLKFVAPHLEHLEVNGYDLYFTKDTLDFERINSRGITNRENMQSGNCPIGSDKELMNFHHLTHYDFATHKIKSIVVLITYTLHTKYSGCFHFGRTTYRDLPRKKVERLLFNAERKTFNRAIAHQK